MMKNRFTYKACRYLLLLTIWVGLDSCEKKDPYELVNPDVETYITQLKFGQYDSITLPAFTWEDIPALLAYRNNTWIIRDFPHNPISSLYAPECTLGMYVLWTIESIRAVAVDSKYLIMRFPSQNPILAYRQADALELAWDDESHRIAAKAYYEWWVNNKHRDFDDFKEIDPLGNTDYKWH